MVSVVIDEISWESLNQKQLTNGSVVKDLIKADKDWHRMEIACYPNKVMAWRQKLESRLSEVLQSDLIYTNVTKAEIANKEHLKDAFQTAYINEIVIFVMKIKMAAQMIVLRRTDKGHRRNSSVCSWAPEWGQGPEPASLLLI